MMLTMMNSKLLLSMAAIAAAVTILASGTVATPAFASSSRHEFRQDVKSFLSCVREHDHSKISKFNFADCLTDNFNIQISKHTTKHL
jgi:hypothetical protein